MSATRVPDDPLSINPERAQPNRSLHKTRSEEPSTSTGITQQYTFNISINPAKYSIKNPEGALPIPKPQLLDDTKFDEPSTSSGIKTHYAINLSLNLSKSKTTLVNDGSLSSLDELALRLLSEKGNVEDNDSFFTVDGCRQDIATSTEPVTLFSRNEQVQNMVMTRNHPPSYSQLPPPYDDDSRSHQGSMRPTTNYQGLYMVSSEDAPDTRSAPPYRRYCDDDIHNVFYTKRIRNNFVQKVYMILSTQLLLAFGFIYFCVHEKNLRHFLERDRLVLVVSSVVSIVSYIVLVCYQQTRRTFPFNFMLFLLWTSSMAYIGAVISCVFNTHVLMVTLGVTAAACVLVSLLACQNKFDITKCLVAFCLIIFISVAYGIIAITITVLTSSKIVYLIYSFLITGVFCMYLMYDTQQILGGRRIELAPDEYILGAIELYVDILIVFIELLQMYGSSFRG